MKNNVAAMVQNFKDKDFSSNTMSSTLNDLLTHIPTSEVMAQLMQQADMCMNVN